MKFFYKNLIIKVPETVYYPMEDSLLLAKVIENEDLKKKKILEIGSGSGFLAILMEQQGAEVLASDINEEAVKAVKLNAKNNNIDLKVISSNLFEKVEGNFDFIIFNPPYLPEKTLHRDNQYYGGKTGREVIQKFIENSGKHLKKNGRIFIVFSSITGEKEIIEIFHSYGFISKVLARQKVPWEELIVVEAVKNTSSKIFI